MRVAIDVDEKWPFYTVAANDMGDHNIPYSKLQWVSQVMRDFEEVQKYLSSFVGNDT